MLLKKIDSFGFSLNSSRPMKVGTGGKEVDRKF